MDARREGTLLSIQAQYVIILLVILDFKFCLKTRFIILDRATGNRLSVRYTAPAFFFLHHINAYEDSNHLVVDLITFKSAEVLDTFLLEYARSSGFVSKDISLPKRFVIPLPAVVVIKFSNNGSSFALQGYYNNYITSISGWC